MSCEAISGTQYQSSEERLWFWWNCMPLVQADDSQSSQSGTTSSSPSQPATTEPATPVQVVGTSTLEQFAAGYRWAGGPEAYLSHILYNVIPCESTGNPYAINYGGPYYGLMQFAPVTWNASGGGDWFSPWQQGANTARLLSWALPGGQWPYCWYVGW